MLSNWFSIWNVLPSLSNLVTLNSVYKNNTHLRIYFFLHRKIHFQQKPRNKTSFFPIGNSIDVSELFGACTRCSYFQHERCFPATADHIEDVWLVKRMLPAIITLDHWSNHITCSWKHNWCLITDDIEKVVPLLRLGLERLWGTLRPEAYDSLTGKCAHSRYTNKFHFS